MRHVQDRSSKGNKPTLDAPQPLKTEMSAEDAGRLFQTPVRRRVAEPGRRKNRQPAGPTADLVARTIGQINSELTVMLNAAGAAAGTLHAGDPPLALLMQAEAATRRAAAATAKLLDLARRQGGLSGNVGALSTRGGGI